MSDDGLADGLARAAAQLFEVPLSSAAAHLLVAHARLVEDWSKRMNLVSASGIREIVERHVLDSLAVAWVVAPAASVLDVGSGAGFPGLVLAIARPDARVVLLEKRQKRVSFLRHAVRRAGAENVTVVEGDGSSSLPGGSVDLVVGRGVAREDLAAVAVRHLAKGGALGLMRKQGAVDPDDGWEPFHRAGYRLPSGDRHEVVALRPRST